MNARSAMLIALVLLIAGAASGQADKSYHLFVDGALVPDVYAVKRGKTVYVPLSKVSTNRYPVTIGFFAGSPTFYMNKREYTGDWFAAKSVFYLAVADVERITAYQVTLDETRRSVGLWLKYPTGRPQGAPREQPGPRDVAAGRARAPEDAEPGSPPPQGGSKPGAVPKPEGREPEAAPKQGEGEGASPDGGSRGGAQETPPPPVPIDSTGGEKSPEGKGESPKGGSGGAEKTPPAPVPLGSSAGEGSSGSSSSVRVIKDRIFVDRGSQDTVKVEAMLQNLGARPASLVVVTLTFSYPDGRAYSTFHDRIDALTPGQTKTVTMDTAFRHVKKVDQGRRSVTLEIAEAYGKMGFQTVELRYSLSVSELGGGQGGGGADAGQQSGSDKVEILSYQMYSRKEHPFLIVIEAKLQNSGGKLANVALVFEADSFNYGSGKMNTEKFETKLYDFAPKDVKLVTLPTTMSSLMWYDKSKGVMQIDTGVTVKVQLKYRLRVTSIEGRVK